MISYEIHKVIEDLYNKCETIEEVTELEEEMQGINSSIAGERWTVLSTEVN